jgi:8-oxo-dGTP pyrophosphatase MutT (NUDIX family)
MLKKIFIKEKTWFIDSTYSNYLPREFDWILQHKNKEQLQATYSLFIKTKGLKKALLIAKNEAEAWNDFCSIHEVINAAGGLVQNKQGLYLLIFRKGKWDLPKGKMEKGESPEKAGIREVEEECGINKLSIVKNLGITSHTYELNGVPVLKNTYWFLMKTNSENPLVPQLEEDITDAQWMDKDQVKEALKNTYPLIKELLMNQVLKS